MRKAILFTLLILLTISVPWNVYLFVKKTNESIAMQHSQMEQLAAAMIIMVNYLENNPNMKLSEYTKSIQDANKDSSQ